MLGSLWHAPKPKSDDEKEQPLGASTIGSSEACMLGGLALKRRWQVARKKAGKPTDKPNLVLGANAQVPSTLKSPASKHLASSQALVYCGGCGWLCASFMAGVRRLDDAAGYLTACCPAVRIRDSPMASALQLRKDVYILLHLTCASPQVCWEKFCEYWDVEGRYVPVTKDYPVSSHAVSDLSSFDKHLQDLPRTPTGCSGWTGMLRMLRGSGYLRRS